MRFVSAKSPEQRSVLALHTAREGLVHARSAQATQIRGLLLEFGLLVRQGIHHVYESVPGPLMMELLQEFHALESRIDLAEARIKSCMKQSTPCKKIAAVADIGPITATALVAAVGETKEFKNGRHLAAWLGLVPSSIRRAGSRASEASASVATLTCARY